MKWWMLALLIGGGAWLLLRQKEPEVITGGVLSPDQEKCKRAVGCFLQRYELHGFSDGDAAAKAFVAAKAVCQKVGVDPVKMEESMDRSTWMFMQGC
jgi:hypothetical protein